VGAFVCVYVCADIGGGDGILSLDCDHRLWRLHELELRFIIKHFWVPRDLILRRGYEVGCASFPRFATPMGGATLLTA
jgi:hypothetical protein